MTRFSCVSTAAVLGFCLWNPPARAVENLWDCEKNLVRYHETDYLPKIAAIDRKVAAYIVHRAAGGSAHLALVLDIDETSLSDWEEMTKDVDFGYNPEIYNRWAELGDAPAIAPTLALFRQAKAAGISVFFITGRPEELRQATETNLRKVGYVGWTELDLKPKSFQAPPGATSKTAAYKTGCRKAIEAKGYVIIANVGDQHSDLDGGYSERDFKLPNPFYRIP
jgi:predicted secreted acid phosphatase